MAIETTFGVILAAAIAGIGSGVGVAIGQALYKAFFEKRIEAFLDKQKREEALKKIAEQPSIISEKIKSRAEGNGWSSQEALNKMLGRR